MCAPRKVLTAIIVIVALVAKDGLSVLISATAFAAERHRGQRRKNAEASPYINHPIALASVLVTDAGVDDVSVVAAALLHDTIEDTATTAEELLEAFGQAIAGLVREGSPTTRSCRRTSVSACRSSTHPFSATAQS